MPRKTESPLDLAQRMMPITISARTCLIATGMSWDTIRAFAAENGVPIWKVKSRPVISGPLLAAAMERVARMPQPEPTASERDEEFKQLVAERREQIERGAISYRLNGGRRRAARVSRDPA